MSEKMAVRCPGCGSEASEKDAPQKYGRLEIVCENGRSKRGHVLVLCKCDCGNETVAKRSDVKRGNTKSCGCLKHKNPHNYNGGESKTRLYRVWESMHARCKKQINKSYYNYGARGIKVCDGWDNYVAFKKWASESGYSDNLTIDRIDVNGMYVPENCRWIPKADQQNNKRNNRYIQYGGKTMCLTQWAREIGINPRTLNGRLAHGWSVKRAFETPICVQLGKNRCRPTDAERAAAPWGNSNA